MPIYEYKCDEDGRFEELLPLGTAPDANACPVCGVSAQRIMSTPSLMRNDPAIVAAIDNADKSRYEPEVVTSLPPRHPRDRTPMAPLTPALSKLPRP